MIGSVIVPAHNEARVIGRTLRSVMRTLDPGEIELIVVANGCSDDTAAQARSAAPNALVIEDERASKPNALRVGEAAASVLPRLYVDADIQVTSEAVRATLAALAAGAVAARPPLRYDAALATWPVRSYYRARSRMPSLLGHAWGAGVYGLSAHGRARFEEFPDVLGDDLFVDRLLRPGELVVVDTDPAVVATPRDGASLRRILRRAQRTKLDHRGKEATAGQDTQGDAIRDLASVATASVSGPLDGVVYAAFAASARIGQSSRRGSAWERDESSRAT